jgi:hypothetical protein
MTQPVNIFFKGVSQAVAPVPTATYFPTVNTFSIASVILPGKWTLLSAEKLFGWQIQQGYGLSGAFVFPKGDELVVAKFRGEFWASADWLQFTIYRKTLFKKPAFTVPGGLATAALGIDHPELKAQGVTSVVVLKVGVGTNDGHGLWSIEVELLQYRPPVKALPIPKTKIPDVAAPTPSATTNAQIEMQTNAATITSLLGK